LRKGNYGIRIRRTQHTSSIANARSDHDGQSCTCSPKELQVVYAIVLTVIGIAFPYLLLPAEWEFGKENIGHIIYKGLQSNSQAYYRST